MRQRKYIWKPPAGAQIDWGDPITSGLIGVWLMNEGGGITSFDIARNNNGVLTSGPIWKPGDLGGKAISFDGIDDYVSVPYNSILDCSKITIVCRFKDNGSGGGLVEKTIGGSVNTQYLFFTFSGLIYWRFTDGTTLNDVTTAYSTGVWNTTVATYDKATQKVYLNGVLKTSASVSTSITTGSGAMYFGKLANNYMLTGLIDHILIFNRALSASEIQRLYGQPFCFIRGPVISDFIGDAAGGTVYTDSQAESGSASGAQTAAATFSSAITETGTFSDTQTAIATFASTISESGTLSDVQSSTASFVSSSSESGSLSDAQTSNATFVSDLTESLSGSESSTGFITSVGSASESGTLADSQSATVVFASSLTESGSLSDAPNATAIMGCSQTESGSCSDSSEGSTNAIYDVAVGEELDLSTSASVSVCLMLAGCNPDPFVYNLQGINGDAITPAVITTQQCLAVRGCESNPFDYDLQEIT